MFLMNLPLLLWLDKVIALFLICSDNMFAPDWLSLDDSCLPPARVRCFVSIWSAWLHHILPKPCMEFLFFCKFFYPGFGVFTMGGLEPRALHRSAMLTIDGNWLQFLLSIRVFWDFRPGWIGGKAGNEFCEGKDSLFFVSMFGVFNGYTYALFGVPSALLLSLCTPSLEAYCKSNLFWLVR